jgi:hypothetical protein
LETVPAHTQNRVDAQKAAEHPAELGELLRFGIVPNGYRVVRAAQGGRKANSMSLKDTFDKGLDAVKKGAENVKDTVSELGHRTAAEGEQTKRDVAGDEMTLGEKAGSVIHQGTETVKGDIDAGKRDVRSNL